MHSRVERLRRLTSWLVAVMLLLVILLSNALSRQGLFYEVCEILGYGLIVLAVLGRIWCSAYIGGRKDEELCNEGPYSMCRNPLYLFSFLGTIGIVLAAQSILLVLIVVPIYWGYYYFVIRSEERRLLQMFGSRFTAYCSKVNRLVPSFKNYRTRNSVLVNTNVLFRSIMDASVFMWVIILLEIMEDLKIADINGNAALPILWHLPF